jgi:hypothetical protein
VEVKMYSRKLGCWGSMRQIHHLALSMYYSVSRLSGSQGCARRYFQVKSTHSIQFIIFWWKETVTEPKVPEMDPH